MYLIENPITIIHYPGIFPAERVLAMLLSIPNRPKVIKIITNNISIYKEIMNNPSLGKEHFVSTSTLSSSISQDIILLAENIEQLKGINEDTIKAHIIYPHNIDYCYNLELNTKKSIGHIYLNCPNFYSYHPKIKHVLKIEYALSMFPGYSVILTHKKEKVSSICKDLHIYQSLNFDYNKKDSPILSIDIIDDSNYTFLDTLTREYGGKLMNISMSKSIPINIIIDEDYECPNKQFLAYLTGVHNCTIACVSNATYSKLIMLSNEREQTMISMKNSYKKIKVCDNGSLEFI